MRFWEALKGSCSGFGFYPKAGREGAGGAIKFLLLFLLLVALLAAVRVPLAVRPIVSEVKKWMEKEGNIKEIRLQNGELHVDVQQPYVVEDEGAVIIIDTTGTINEVPGKHEKCVLITKDKVVTKEPNKTESFDFKNIPFNLTLTPEKLVNYAKTISLVLMPIVFVSVYVWCFVSKLIQGLIYSVLALIVNSAKGGNLEYGGLYAISVFALIPGTVLAVVLAFFPQLALLRVLLYLILAVVLVIGGTARAAKAPAAEAEQGPPSPNRAI